VGLKWGVGWVAGRGGRGGTPPTDLPTCCHAPQGCRCAAIRVAVMVARLRREASGLATLGFLKTAAGVPHDTATSLRSEDVVWHAFRRDASAARERR